jgi:outer membrane protein assembly factor BamB
MTLPRRATLITLCVLLCFSVALLRARPAARPGVDWPMFRGIDASGVSEGKMTPATLDPAAAAWKTGIPGLGLSSPVIWGDLLCVTTAISGKKDAGVRVGLYGDIASVPDDTPHEWKVICLDKKSGRINWQQTAYTGVPKIKRHQKNSHANATLATDGTHLAAFFGSEGLYVYDLKGKLLWNKDLGLLDAGFYMVPQAQWETGSSPVIYDGKLLVLADVQKDSFLAAFDVKTGKELWRTPRADVPTWGSPAVFAVNGREQVVVNGWRHTGGYDLATGQEIWKLNGGGDIPVPTPIFGHGLIFITNAHGSSAPVYAIKPTAAGDISLAGDATSNQHIAWSVPRDGGYMATPLLYGDYLYVVKYQCILTVFNAKTGERAYQQRLGSGTSACTASPVANNGRVYFGLEEGDVYVIKAGPTFEQVALNKLDEPLLATPAISEGTLYLRTKDRILAFGPVPGERRESKEIK